MRNAKATLTLEQIGRLVRGETITVRLPDGVSVALNREEFNGRVEFNYATNGSQVTQKYTLTTPDSHWPNLDKLFDRLSKLFD